MNDLLIVILLLAILSGASVIYWTFRNGISPMPTARKVKKKLFESLPASSIGPVYELGSGWGTLAFPLAKKYPKSSVIGYETSWIPYLYSKFINGLISQPNLSFRRENFFKASLSDAGLIVCYLYPKAMQQLKIKFEQEVPSTALLISHTFAVPGWTPLQTIEVDDLYKTKIYLYKIKKNS